MLCTRNKCCLQLPYCNHRRVEDVQVLARQRGHQRVNMEALTQQLLTSRYQKSHDARTCDWGSDAQLTEEQVRYAALDAILPLYLHKRLTDGSTGY